MPSQQTIQDWLMTQIAELLYIDPEKIEDEFGDETLVRNALRNCLDFIKERKPLPQAVE